MNSPEGNQGFAFGQSTQFFIDPVSDYLIAFDLMITAPYSGPYEGWYTAVDDGNVWLIIDGEYDSEHGSLTTYGRKGQVLPPLTPLQFDKWYYLECRVHAFDEEYDIYVNGVYQGTQYFDRGNTSQAVGFLTIGDTSPELDAYGEAFWDNILVSHFVDYPWSDEIDNNIDDWTTIVTDTNYFGWWEGGLVGRPDSFVLRMQLNGRETFLPPGHAKGVTPYYDQPRDVGYVLSFWFMVQYPFNSEFKVVDDGRIWLMISPSGTDLAVYVDEVDVRYVDTLVPGVWHNILCRVDTQSSTYGLYLDDSLKDNYDFSQFDEEYFARPMAPKNLLMGGLSDDLSDGAEAYWDDFKIEADSDGDGLSDWEELNGYRGTYYHGYITDPFDPDTDGDGLIDSIEVGLSPYDSDSSTTTDPTDDDHDDDGLMDGTEDANHDGYLEPGDWNEGAGPGETDPIDPDTDGDRLTDGLEVGLESPEGSDTASPPWGTKIDLGYGPDLQPLTTTDPLDADTDNDGLPDGWMDFNTNDDKDDLEYEDRDLDGERDGDSPFNLQKDWNDGDGPGETDPNEVDTDRDYVTDYQEIAGAFGFLTDPLAPDSDGDHAGDGMELGVSPEDIDPQSTTDPLDKDTDDDGIYDGTEDGNMDGGVTSGETNPVLRDTDGDKLTDGQEIGMAYPEGYDSYVQWQNDPYSDTAAGSDGFATDIDSGATTTDPVDFDTDDDGLPDGWKDFNDDGYYDFGEFEDINLDGFVEIGNYGNNPGDGETDPNVPDTDNDEASDYVEIVVHSPSTSPLLGDTDGDDIPDGWEIEHGLNPLNSGDRNQHYDTDGVTNYDEFVQDTNPWDWDTDCDFLSDNPNVDPNPLVYHLKKSIDPKYVLEDVDVVVITSLQSMGRNVDVSVAIDYSTPSTILPEIYDASSGPYQIENGVLVGSVVKVFVRTDYHLDYTAVVKVKYRPEELPGGTEENDLLMYYHDGYVTLNGAPQLHWTLFLHENDYLHEDTSRDMQNNFVWAKTNHLGYFGMADTTLQSIEYDEHSDGEDINVAEYDPDYFSLCTDIDNCYGEIDLLFHGDEYQTLYAKIWLDDGSIEEILISDPNELQITGQNYYGPFEMMTEGNSCPIDTIRSSTFFAQSFKEDSFGSTPPSAVEVYAFVQNLDANGDLRIDIYTDDDGKPSSTSLGYGSIRWNSSQWPDPPNEHDAVWVRVIAPLDSTLSDDTLYWIVASSLETNPPNSYLWNGYATGEGEEDPYPIGNAAVTTDGGSTWDIWDDYDLGFKIHIAGYPVDPELNVLRADEGDPYINWDYNGMYDGNEMVSNFRTDFNVYLSQYQSNCVNGVCTPYEGYVLVPFEFHSTTKGYLQIDQIHIRTAATPTDSGALLVDTDQDGLSDAVEQYHGTLPNNPHSDGDGLSDGEEVLVWGTDPNSEHSDSDTFDDGEEVNLYHTNPCDEDTDGDGTLDDVDMDPLVMQEITVKIKEINQLDKVDDDDAGDFYWKVTINTITKKSDYPGTNRNKPHETPNWEETWYPLGDQRYVQIEIELWDEDSGSDQLMDISSAGSTLDIEFDTQSGEWSGEDFLGDINGYGHSSGDEDLSGPSGTGADEDDCEVWFEVTFNDLDGDGLTYHQEVNNHGTDPGLYDTDGDGLSDREALYQPTLDPLTWNNPLDDPDGDTLLNVQEVNSFLTDPTSEDTDGDHIRDDRDSQPTRYNRRFAFLLEALDNSGVTELGYDTIEDLWEEHWDYTYLVSDFDYFGEPIKYDVYKYYTHLRRQEFDEELLEFYFDTVATYEQKDGDDIVYVHLAGHGTDFLWTGEWFYALHILNGFWEWEIRWRLAIFGRSLDFVWLQSCESGHAFDQWGRSSGTLVVGSTELMDSGAGTWEAAAKGCTIGGQNIDGFLDGNSVEASLVCANDREDGHDISMDDNYPDNLYVA